MSGRRTAALVIPIVVVAQCFVFFKSFFFLLFFFPSFDCYVRVDPRDIFRSNSGDDDADVRRVPATAVGHENTLRHPGKLCSRRRAGVHARRTDVPGRIERVQAVGDPK